MCVFSIYMTRLFTAWGRAGKSWRKKKAGELGTYQLPLIKALKLAFRSSFGCGEQRDWALVIWPTHGIRSPLTPNGLISGIPGTGARVPSSSTVWKTQTRHFLFPQIILWIVESGKCVESGKTREKSGISQGGIQLIVVSSLEDSSHWFQPWLLLELPGELLKTISV